MHISYALINPIKKTQANSSIYDINLHLRNLKILIAFANYSINLIKEVKIYRV